MQQIANFAEAFIKLFNLGGENLMGLVTGILPTLLVLITLVIQSCNSRTSKSDN